MASDDVKVQGPHLAKLKEKASKCESFGTTVVVKFDKTKLHPESVEVDALLRLSHHEKSRWSTPKTLAELHTYDAYHYVGHVDEGMETYARLCDSRISSERNSVLDYTTVTVECRKAPVSTAEMKMLATQAWCEAFGAHVPDAGEYRAFEKKIKDETKTRDARCIAALKAGIDEWKKIPPRERITCDYANADLQAGNMAGQSFDHISFKGANFDKADLRNAVFNRADFNRATFRGANMQGAKLLREAVILGSDFSGSDLSTADVSCSVQDCKFDNTNITKTKFSSVKKFSAASFANTDMTDAEFFDCDFKDADLSSAILKGNKFGHCVYNSATKFPATFELRYDDGLEFKGGGSDPLKVRSIQASTLSGPIDSDTFINQLYQKCDKDRMKKSLKMLKSETFQLFSQVDENSIVGVVKSQTDPDLVYSCSLNSSGDFSCCTQNLNVCGGLRGAMCKHLLVLLIGLAKSDQLDSTATYQWAISSMARKPELNKDSATEVFLRYKAAESGEIDWRPTETMPEDYYAY